MDLENGSDTTTIKGVERRTVGNGCANPDPLRRHEKGRVYCIGNVPVGCPPKTFSNENSGTLVQPSLKSSSLNQLEKEEVSPWSENDEAKQESSVGLDKLALIKTSSSLHEDSSELLKTDFPVKARVYPPRRKVSGVRTFPPGCGRNKAPTNNVAPVFGTSETGTWAKDEEKHKEEEEELGEESVSPSSENDEGELELSVDLDKLEQIKTPPSPHEDSSKLLETDFPVKARVYPPRRKISGVRTFPPGCGRNKPQTNEAATGFGTSETRTWAKDEEEQKEQTMYTSNGRKSQPDSEHLETGNGNPSNKVTGKSPDVKAATDSMKKEKPATDNVIPGHRPIVLALMAPQNCPWTQKRRVSRTAKGGAQAKATK